MRDTTAGIIAPKLLKEEASASSRKVFCEFFAGIGLVRMGLAASGWYCAYANDISEKKRQLYEACFGSDGHFHLGDVWNRDEVIAKIPGSPFLATASFPCIDTSLAGNWKGFDGVHSSSFFGFVNVLQELARRRPKVVMLENVVGFLTSQDGKDYEAAVRALAELGYWIDSFAVDARYFVPQSRPRIFVIGVHESVNGAPTVRKEESEWFSGRWSSRIDAGGKFLRPPKLVQLMEAIELPTGWAAFDLREPKAERVDIADIIDLDDNQEWWDATSVSKHHDMMSDRHRKIVDEMLESGGKFTGTIYRRKRNGKTRAEIRFDGLAGCLRTPKGGSARQIIIAVDRGQLRIRWMSPREYARLQGAGDFPLVKNTIQNLYGLGDAVCVPVIQWIDKNVLTPVFDAYQAESREFIGGQDVTVTAANDAGGERK
ncbi:DNA cytosine methyltransferase [Schlesneria sp. T3-172]|uniref:DNA cytosine methyltransferase n=1 Tax=Schlesneria sphaerica TaxID=3373610 RepID=UPI0037CAC997